MTTCSVRLGASLTTSHFLIVVLLGGSWGTPLEAQQPPAVAVAEAGGQSAAARLIERALASKITLALTDAPLQEAVGFLSDTAGIPILLDRRALDDVGLTADVPVSCQLRDVSLNSGLTILLRSLDLTFTVRQGTLQITTLEAAENKLEVRLYSVADFAATSPPSLFAGSRSSRFSELANVIQCIVAPDTWAQVGGSGQVTELDSWQRLAVAQTSDVHQRIANLLAALREARTAVSSGVSDETVVSWRADSQCETKAAVRIEQALSRTIPMDFQEAPLSDIADFLQRTAEIPVVINRKALDDVGVTTDVPLTLHLDGVPLRTALETLLHDLDLTYRVADEVLEITTPDDAEREPSVRVYRLPLPPRPSLPAAEAWGESLDDLICTITQTIDVDTWAEVGGRGQIEVLPTWSLMLVSQQESAHHQIEDLLRALGQGPSAAAQAPAAPAATADTADTAPPLVLRIYPLTLPENQHPQLIAAIRAVVAPESWEALPGRPTIQSVGNKLLVRQCPAVHRDIEDLLAALGAMTGNMASGGGMF